MTTIEGVSRPGVEVVLEELNVSDVFQVRQELHEQKIADYAHMMGLGTTFDPIEVASLVDAEQHPRLFRGFPVARPEHPLYLIHGFHRVAAAQRVGLSTLPAIVLPLTFRQALWRAAQANGKNGVPLLKADYPNVFKAYVLSKQYVISRGVFKTYPEITKELGLPVSKYWTIRMMKRYYPHIARALGKEPSASSSGKRGDDVQTPAEVATHRALLHTRSIRDSLQLMGAEGRYSVKEELEHLARAIADLGATPEEW